MLLQRASISVFFPAFNDEASVRRLVTDAFHTVAELTDDFEVIVVNDGSLDATSRVLEELCSEYERLRVVTHDTNLGYGAALRSGFAAATKELIFYTDGDGQYDVRELSVLLAALGPDIDIVNGYKIRRSDNLVRKIAGRLYAVGTRAVFHLPIRDVDCDFRLIRSRVLDGIELSSTSGSICVELVDKLARAGAAFVEVPVHHHPRAAGRSQFFVPARIAATLRELTRLYIRRDRRSSRLPLGLRLSRDTER